MIGKSIYRYRGIDRLLCKHTELESQEIYFANPAELNDPMEGFQDVFWESDRILWKNLIKHYQQSLNATHFRGLRMYIETSAALKLISKYFKN